tara:strand:+ start:540 stop:3158 length:2619 start_codon:yes stop_codon:yes gene_type:complete
MGRKNYLASILAVATVSLSSISMASTDSISYTDWTSNSEVSANYIMTIEHNRDLHTFNYHITIEPWNAEVLGAFIDLGDFDFSSVGISAADDIVITNENPIRSVDVFAIDTEYNDCGGGCNLNGLEIDWSNPDNEWELVFRFGDTGFDGIQTFSFTTPDFGLTLDDFGLVGMRAQQLCSPGELILDEANCEGSDKSYSTPEKKVGEIIWTFPMGESSPSSPAIGEDGTIYLGSIDSYFYAVNPDGTLKWSIATPKAVKSSPVIGAGGIIYFAAEDLLYAVTPEGQEEWSISLGGIHFTHSGISVTPYGDILITTRNGVLNSISGDGQVNWQRDMWGYASPVTSDNGRVYFASREWSSLSTVDKSGKELWTSSEYGFQGSSPAIAPDGSIVLGAMSGCLPNCRVYSYMPDGGLNWSLEIDGAVTSSPVIASDGTVYISAMSGDFYSISKDGKLNWSYDVPPYPVGVIHDYYPVLLEDGTIILSILADGRTTLVALSSSSGHEKWRKNDLPIRASTTTPAIGKDGTIYINGLLDREPVLMALKGRSPLMSSGWPRWTGNNRNSRNSFAVTQANARYDQQKDGKSDIIWRNAADGANWYYSMNGSQIQKVEQINTVTEPWTLIGRGDFNGDGKSDLLWRNESTGENNIQLMDGHEVTSSNTVNYVPVDQGWSIVSIGDYNGDGKDDILFRNANSGELWQYQMNGASIAAIKKVATINSSNWRIVASVDINSDNKSDIIFRNTSTHVVWRYLMDGHVITSSKQLASVSTAWDFAAAGDFDGDGDADLLWRNSVNGLNYVYAMNNGLVDWGSSGQTSQIGDSSWFAAMAGDFDGDGKADILWRNEQTGLNYIHLMDGLSYTGQHMNVVNDPNWKVVK